MNTKRRMIGAVFGLVVALGFGACGSDPQKPEKPEKQPESMLGKWCDSTEECKGDGECWTGPGPCGRHCQVRCKTDADCPERYPSCFGTACIAPCQTDKDCAPDRVCNTPCVLDTNFHVCEAPK